MPSVLLLVDDFPPAVCGIGDYSAHLANALSGRGCVVKVLTKYQPNGATVSENGVVVRPLIRTWAYADLWTVVRELDSMPQGTVIHIQYGSASSYNRRKLINALPALLRILRRRNRVVVTMHGFHERRRLFRLRAAPMLVASHGCIFVHHKDLELASRTLGLRDRSTLVPIASNIPSICSSDSDRGLTRTTIGLSETDRVVLFFGDFREDKGILQLLTASANARSLVPGLKLVLVGGLLNKSTTPVTSYAQRLDDALGRARSEGFLITVDNPESTHVARLLRAGDLAVFPFLDGASENRGSLLAAIVNETATLTTVGKSTPENFAEEHGVAVVQAGDVDALTAGITDLLLDPQRLGCLRQQSSLAAQRCSWAAIGDKHIQVYRQLWETR